jgi:hypothetical protein
MLPVKLPVLSSTVKVYVMEPIPYGSGVVIGPCAYKGVGEFAEMSYRPCSSIFG